MIQRLRTRRSPAEIERDGMTSCGLRSIGVKGSAEGWSLEVVDHTGASTISDDLFATDRDAYAEFEQTLESNDIGSFSGEFASEFRSLAISNLFLMAEGAPCPIGPAAPNAGRTSGSLAHLSMTTFALARSPSAPVFRSGSGSV